MLKLIILDFDGVVVESADIKTEAFRKLFSNFPKHVDAIVEYHKKHAGLSRYEKFAYFYKHILKLPLDDEMIKSLDARFSSLVVEEIKKCPLVPGVLEFLERFSKRVKFFIASSTPKKELLHIIKARNLQKYFQGVYGAPSKKSEIVSCVMSKENVGSDEALFVGDTAEDLVGAKTAGVPFVGRVKNSAKSPFPEGVKTIRDLNDLSIIVEESLCR